MKSHVPGTEQYKETHGQGTAGNTGYSNTTGSGDSYNRGNNGTGNGSNTGTGELLVSAAACMCGDGTVHEDVVTNYLVDL